MDGAMEAAAAAGNIAPPKSTSLFLQIVQHSDGTVTRPLVPDAPPTSDPTSPVLSKDVVLNPEHNTYLRLYLQEPNNQSTTPTKLPILLFFHGGGFVVFHASSIFYHQSCEQLVASFPCLLISVDYRLAPEHRLPAAYDDAVEALFWLRDSADPWITDHGDLSRCFLTGSSSGANIAYHAALRAGALDLAPVAVSGVVLNQPYLGGMQTTLSESASEEDPMIPLRANYLLWRLALPVGADRDHEFCNACKKLKDEGKKIEMPRCLVVGCKGDPLFDRQKEFAEALGEAGVKVVAKMEDEGFHAIELFVPEKAEAFFAAVREFVCGEGQ